MISTIAHDPARWHGFCAAFAGASGALLGLAFVAISLNLEAILKTKHLPGRAIETLVFFAYPLAASLLILLPGLTNTAAGIGQAIFAAGLAGLVLLDLLRWKAEENDPLSWRLSQLTPAVLVAALAIVGALATLTTSSGGLYWLAGAMTIATASGLVNSWVLLVEINR
jgi:modulator of FtsH protease